MKRVLILGGGFGGIVAARTLRQELSPDDEITLVDRRGFFMVGFRKTWALVGESPMEIGQRPLAALAQHGIQIVQGTISTIDPAARAAEVDGRRIEADALIVALGAELAPEQIPGFSQYALNVYDPAGIPRAAAALQAFSKGKVMIGIFGAPYKCPPAPYEMALLVNEALRARGADASVEVFTPQPMSLPVLGEAGCNVIEGRLADNGITFLPNHKATAVEAGEVVFASGRRPFDLLLGVPPHRCPALVVNSGLTDSLPSPAVGGGLPSPAVGGAWVRPNPRTLETKFPGVYAIGDLVEIPMADGKPLPKAGVFAEAMGQVAAEHIAATFAGRQSDAAFKGEGGCFLEVGGGQAVMVQGSFLAQPAPQVALTEPSPQYIEDKRAFEAERLQTWFA